MVLGLEPPVMVASSSAPGTPPEWMNSREGDAGTALLSFTYDGENRMVSDTGAAFVYDGNGTRVRKCMPNCTSPTSSTVYEFSGSEELAEYVG